MALTYNLQLNVIPLGYPKVIALNQYDSDFSIVCNLYTTNGNLVFESGTTASVRGTKADGNGYSADATLNGYTVTIEGDEQMTAVAGDNTFEVVLTKNEKEISSANFILRVERAALDKDTLVSGSKIRELVNVIDRTDEILDAAYTIDSAMENFNEQVAFVRQARDEAVNAASTAATNVQNQLSDDIASVTAVKNYIDQYIRGLVYGDEVSY